MRKTPICFKEQYGSSVYYELMLSIKKDYPDKKFSVLHCYFPMYHVQWELLNAHFECLKIRLEWELIENKLKA